VPANAAVGCIPADDDAHDDRGVEFAQVEYGGGLGKEDAGVILSGTLDEGTAGLWAIKQLGGVAIVQDPADAPFPSMPQSAIDHVQADYVVPLAAIPSVLSSVVEAPMSERTPGPASRTLDVEVRIAGEDDPIAAGVTTIGDPSTFTCPECHGVLLQLKEAGRVRFRCHTGHASRSRVCSRTSTRALRRGTGT